MNKDNINNNEITEENNSVYDSENNTTENSSENNFEEGEALDIQKHLVKKQPSLKIQVIKIKRPKRRVKKIKRISRSLVL